MIKLYNAYSRLTWWAHKRFGRKAPYACCRVHYPDGAPPVRSLRAV